MLLIAAPAAAQTPTPAVEPPAMEPSVEAPPPVVVLAPSAPQNEPWSNVSHINGQVVPVGERGNYLREWKKTNISANPFGWMFGFYGVSVAHAVHDNVTLRGDVNIMSFDGESGYELGFSAPIYFKRVFQGPFIEPGVIVRDLDCTDCADAPMMGPEMLVGWHWTFDSGLNAAVAVGAARNLNHEQTTDGKGGFDTTFSPAGYFRIGYAM